MTINNKYRTITFSNIAFSNNVAEQAVRMVKSKTRISGGFRTLKGAQTFLAIRGLTVLDAITRALNGPWLPANRS